MTEEKDAAEINIGDYVHATRYSDRDPSDPWSVGFVSEIGHDSRGIFYRVEGDGPGDKSYRCARRITAQEGADLLDEDLICREMFGGIRQAEPVEAAAEIGTSAKVGDYVCASHQGSTCLPHPARLGSALGRYSTERCKGFVRGVVESVGLRMTAGSSGSDWYYVLRGAGPREDRTFRYVKLIDESQQVSDKAPDAILECLQEAVEIVGAGRVGHCGTYEVYSSSVRVSTVDKWRLALRDYAAAR